MKTNPVRNSQSNHQKQFMNIFYNCDEMGMAVRHEVEANNDLFLQTGVKAVTELELKDISFSVNMINRLLGMLHYKFLQIIYML